MSGCHKVVLTGCAPTPLARYLKALGVLRLVGEQVDAQARGCWRGEAFVLQSSVDADRLASFFLQDYVPTPIVAPWNGGSGFYPKDKKDGIEAIDESSDVRFAAYRDIVRHCRGLLKELALKESPKNKDKAQLVSRLRATLPDAALTWLDAAVVLSSEALRFPPLLGTGGNDGRLDFSNNFMQRVTELLDPKTGSPRPGADTFLSGSLFQRPTALLPSKAVGQFDPGGVGGPNATAGFESDSLVNPWDFVLMLEGAVVLAGAATRRLSAPTQGWMGYPFTVRVSGRGAGSLSIEDEEAARAEMWMPLWSRPATFAEIRGVFSEGRLTLGRHLARDGLDVARAIAALGTDRGIDAFQRYGFLMRSGKAFLAVPSNRVAVQRNVAADLIADLERDRWLDRVRRRAREKSAPARLKLLARGLEDGLFAMTQREDPSAVQSALTAVAAVERYVASSPSLQKEMRPLPPLDAQWAKRADDGTHEFGIAAAIASLRWINPALRCFFYPVADDTDRGGRTRFHWNAGSRICVWQGGLIPSMTAVLARRLLESERRAETRDKAEVERRRQKPLEARRGAGLGAVSAFLTGAVDEARTEALIESLVLVRSLEKGERERARPLLPVPYLLLKLLFVPERALWSMEVLADGRPLPVPPGLLRLLASGRPGSGERALDSAIRRLRASGVRPQPNALDLAGLDPRRLAASLLIPLDWSDIGWMADRICIREDRREGVRA